MEYLLDKQENLDQPVLTKLPISEVFLKLELSRRAIDQRVEYLRLEMYYWHRFWIVGREGNPEFEDSILVDALLAEVDTLPVGELRARVVW